MRLPATIALMCAASTAYAGGNDFRLNALNNGQGVLFSESGGGFVANDEAWRALAGELAYVFAPRIASPAETLGHAGFHVGALWSGTFVSSEQPYWGVTEAGQRGDPASVLQTLQLDLRKGLPYSFEVGATFAWLVDSELFAPGLEVRWAVHEGYEYAPDIGLRGSVTHVVGNRDLNMTIIGLDAVISRSFGIGGVVNLAPYLSYSVMLVAASSRVLDPTPTNEADLGLNIVLAELRPTSNLQHKLTVGARLLVSLLNITVQGEFEMFRDTSDGTQFFGPVATISTKIGLDY